MVPPQSDRIASVLSRTHTILSHRQLIHSPDCVPQFGCDSYAGSAFNPNADPGRGAQLRYAGSPGLPAHRHISSRPANYTIKFRPWTGSGRQSYAEPNAASNGV